MVAYRSNLYHHINEVLEHQKSYDEFQEDMRGVKERIRREREDIDRVKLEKLEQSKRNLNLQM